MGIEPAIDITAEQRKTVLLLLEKHLPNTTAWVYGSRAKWTARPQSDLDMVVFATPEQNTRAFALREAFEESNLPFRVDLFVWDDVPERFRKQIEAKYVVLVAKERKSVRDGWKTVTLGEFAPFTYGKGLPVGKRNPSGVIPVFGSNGIVGYHDSSLTDGPTIIIGRKGTVGAVHYSSISCWPIDTTFFITGNDPALVKFKYYALSMLGLEHMNSDSAVPGLNRSDAHARTLLVPAPMEQRAIAHILGTLDDKIELNRRMNETLEEMARALFKSWFVDFDPVRAKMEGRDTGLPPDVDVLFPDRLVDSELGEIPEGWEVKTLNCFAALNPESWSQTNHPKGVKYVDLANTKWGVIEATQYYSWKDAPSRAKRVLRSGDTIVGTVRPGNGSYSLVGQEGLTGSTGFVVFRPIHPRYRELVYLSATSAENIKRLAHRADGAAYPAVRPNVVEETRVVAPSVGTDILNIFSMTVAPIVNRMESNKAEAHALTALRETLLPKLVSGEVRVRENI